MNGIELTIGVAVIHEILRFGENCTITSSPIIYL